MKSITLKVEGIHCQSCGMLIQALLKEVCGVKDVKVDVTEKKVIIEFDETKTSEAQLCIKIKAEGYRVE